jgi:hypothetical protein
VETGCLGPALSALGYLEPCLANGLERRTRCAKASQCLGKWLSASSAVAWDFSLNQQPALFLDGKNGAA